MFFDLVLNFLNNLEIIVFKQGRIRGRIGRQDWNSNKEIFVIMERRYFFRLIILYYILKKMIRLFAINVEIRIFCIKFFHFTLLISTIINSPIQIIGNYRYIYKSEIKFHFHYYGKEKYLYCCEKQIMYSFGY